MCAHVTIWDWILIIISWTARSLSEYISRRFLVWCLASLTVQPPHWLTDGLYLKQTDSMTIPGRGSQHFMRKKETVWLLVVATVHVKVNTSIAGQKMETILWILNFSVYYKIIILLQNTLKLIHTRKLNLILFGIQCMFMFNGKQLLHFIYPQCLNHSLAGSSVSIYTPFALTFKGTWLGKYKCICSICKFQVHLGLLSNSFFFCCFLFFVLFFLLWWTNVICECLCYESWISRHRWKTITIQRRRSGDLFCCVSHIA